MLKRLIVGSTIFWGQFVSGGEIVSFTEVKATTVSSGEYEIGTDEVPDAGDDVDVEGSGKGRLLDWTAVPESGVLVSVSDEVAAELIPVNASARPVDDPLLVDKDPVVVGSDAESLVLPKKKLDIVVERSSDGSLIGSDQVDGSVAAVSVNSLSGSPFTSSVVGAGTDSLAQDNGSLTSVKPRTVRDYDPFSVMVRWSWDRITVGEAVGRLSNFIGYTLLVEDDYAMGVYGMPIPGSHRVVSGLNVRSALELLGGPAFTVVVNHSNRSLMHVLKPGVSVAEAGELPLCAEDVGFVVQLGNAWITDSGRKCIKRSVR